MTLLKTLRIDAKRLRESARGAPCQLRIGGVCNHDPTTTVLCHKPTGSGTGMKSDDFEAAIGCHACHDVIDGRDRVQFYSRDLRLALFYEGVLRTHRYWLSTGLMKL